MYNVSTPVGVAHISKGVATEAVPDPLSGFGFFNFKNSLLDISTFCVHFENKNSIKNFGYSAYRRYIKSINRINYLQYIDFDFGRSTAITFSINEDYIDDKKAIRNALCKVEKFLRRKGIKYYIVAKELGEKTNRLHYHYIVFNCPFINKDKITKIWGLGWVWLQEVVNYKGGIVGGVAYIVSYLKKGLNLQFSRAFFKEGILRNDVYYTVYYDKVFKRVFPHPIFGTYITKKDYRIFSGRCSASELALLEWYNWKDRNKDFYYYQRLYSEVLLNDCK